MYNVQGAPIILQAKELVDKIKSSLLSLTSALGPIVEEDKAEQVGDEEQQSEDEASTVVQEVEEEDEPIVRLVTYSPNMTRP
jgi:hypothetical protein